MEHLVSNWNVMVLLLQVSVWLSRLLFYVQYGQQMMMGQTRPVYYYAPEMQQYRGRNF
jgi:hypothetical protein